MEKYRDYSNAYKVNRDTNRHKFAPGCVSWAHSFEFSVSTWAKNAVIQSCLNPFLLFIHVHEQGPKVEGLEENGRNYWNFGHISKPLSTKEWCGQAQRAHIWPLCVLFHHITVLSVRHFVLILKPQKHSSVTAQRTWDGISFLLYRLTITLKIKLMSMKSFYFWCYLVNLTLFFFCRQVILLHLTSWPMLTWSCYATEKQEWLVVLVAISSHLVSLPNDI